VYFGVRVVGVVALLCVGWIVAGLVGRPIGGTMRKTNVDETLTRFVTRLSHWGI
jgi:hypothetical protein